MASQSASTFHSSRISVECPKSSSVSDANRKSGSKDGVAMATGTIHSGRIAAAPAAARGTEGSDPFSCVAARPTLAFSPSG
eukprot:7383360-Prymnesium_polylepis.1